MRSFPILLPIHNHMALAVNTLCVLLATSGCGTAGNPSPREANPIRGVVSNVGADRDPSAGADQGQTEGADQTEALVENVDPPMRPARCGRLGELGLGDTIPLLGGRMTIRALAGMGPPPEQEPGPDISALAYQQSIWLIAREWAQHSPDVADAARQYKQFRWPSATSERVSDPPIGMQIVYLVPQTHDHNQLLSPVLDIVVVSSDGFVQTIQFRFERALVDQDREGCTSLARELAQSLLPGETSPTVFTDDVIIPFGTRSASIELPGRWVLFQDDQQSAKLMQVVPFMVGDNHRPMIRFQIGRSPVPVGMGSGWRLQRNRRLLGEDATWWIRRTGGRRADVRSTNGDVKAWVYAADNAHRTQMISALETGLWSGGDTVGDE